jgi:hypothetical protein
MALVATCASTATAATIVVEPFGSGWTPGTTWATSGTYTPRVATDDTQAPTTSPAGATTGASAAAGATGATFALAVGAGSVVLMSVHPAEAGRLIVSGARGAGWKTRAITPKSIAVTQAGVPVNLTATITPATTALLLTGSVKVRLAATMVSPSGSRTTSYKTITLRRATPPPVVG